MWARRSGVDHSLGMGEAPGSNPGESIKDRFFIIAVDWKILISRPKRLDPLRYRFDILVRLN